MGLRFNDYFTFQEKQKECVALVGKKSYIYYGGARGGGKTYCAIGIAMMVACQFPGIQIVIMRKTLEELKQYIIRNFTRIFPEGALYRYHKSEKTVYMYNGSMISFRPMRDQADAEKEQGIGRHMYIIDEANLIASDILISLRGSLRNGEIPGWKTCMLCLGNPGGISDLWFKNRYIFPDYSKWEPGELEDKDEYAFVQAYVYDNPELLKKDPTYIRKLQSQPEHRRRAWLDGDWNVFAGQFFEDWNASVHVIDGFDIPADWARWRGIDLGKGSHPSVCLWFAQCSEDWDYDGVIYPAGTIFCYRELTNYETPNNFAKEIVEKTFVYEDFIASYADPNIWADQNDIYDNEQYFRQEGLFLTKSSNKRPVGWASMKQWLNWKGDEQTGVVKKLPKLIVFKECVGLIETIPTLQYKGEGKEDCDTLQQDDYADAARYFIMGLDYGWIYNNKGVKTGEFEEREQDIRMKTLEQKMSYDPDFYYSSFGDGDSVRSQHEEEFNYADFGDLE